jgi:beta-lactamase regulating signal transducer with metallopeptidase domain
MMGAQAMFDALTDLLLRGTVVLLASGLAAVLLARASAASRHTVLTAGLLAVLALPAARLLLPRIDLPVLVTLAPMRQSAGETGEADAAAPVSAASDVPLSSLSTRSGLVVAVVVLWVIGVAVMAARWIRASGHLRASLEAAVPLADLRILDRARAVARELGLRRDPLMLVDAGTSSPLVWGMRRPVLLLPREAIQWNALLLESVLVHELTHLVRRDHLSLSIARLATCFAWCHPLVWAVARRARLEQERACDDAVLARGLRASDYGAQLLQLARGRQRGTTAHGTLAMARSSGLAARLAAILDPRGSRRPRSPFSVAIGTALLAATAPIAAARPSASITVIPSVPDPASTTLTRLRPAPPPLTVSISVQIRTATAAVPDLSGTWVPESSDTAWNLFAVGLIDVPGDGMVIEQDATTIRIRRHNSQAVSAWSAMTGRPVDTVIRPDRVSYPLDRRSAIWAGWDKGRLVITRAGPEAASFTYYSVDGDRLRVEWTGRNHAVLFFRRAGAPAFP